MGLLKPPLVFLLMKSEIDEDTNKDSNPQILSQKSDSDLLSEKSGFYHKLKKNKWFERFLQSRWCSYCLCWSCSRLIFSEIKLINQKRTLENFKKRSNDPSANLNTNNASNELLINTQNNMLVGNLNDDPNGYGLDVTRNSESRNTHLRDSGLAPLHSTENNSYQNRRATAANLGSIFTTQPTSKFRSTANPNFGPPIIVNEKSNLSSKDPTGMAGHTLNSGNSTLKSSTKPGHVDGKSSDKSILARSSNDFMSYIDNNPSFDIVGGAPVGHMEISIPGFSGKNERQNSSLGGSERANFGYGVNGGRVEFLDRIWNFIRGKDTQKFKISLLSARKQRSQSNPNRDDRLTKRHHRHLSGL